MRPACSLRELTLLLGLIYAEVRSGLLQDIGDRPGFVYAKARGEDGFLENVTLTDRQKGLPLLRYQRHQKSEGVWYGTKFEDQPNPKSQPAQHGVINGR